MTFISIASTLKVMLLQKGKNNHRVASHTKSINNKNQLISFYL